MGKRVLVVTYYFPPRPGVASLRLRGLAKYLPEHGWEPVILTAALPGTPEPDFRVIQTPYPGDITACWKRRLGLAGDKGFQEQIGVPRALRERKASFTTKIVNLLKAVIVYPDEQKGWYPFALEVGHDLLKRERFDALLSSSGPVTSHLVARELKARHRLPWIADIRDLWTQNHYYPYGPIRRAIERKLELRTLAAADALVTVSSPLAEELASLHRGKSVFAIPNGFDPDEIGSAPLTEEFTITYTGLLYYEGKRDPAPLFRVLRELIDEGVLDPRLVRVRFFGPAEYWLEQEVKQYGLQRIVEIYGVVPRDIVLQHQRASQILLLLNWNDPHERGVYTGKLFEYLAAQRPILAIGGPKGVVAELLEETGAGVYVPQTEDLKRVLVEFYKEYKTYGQVQYHGRAERITRYSHREMARKFAEVLNLVMHR